MNLILSIIICIILFIYVKYLLEGFQTTSVSSLTTSVSSLTTSVSSLTSSVSSLTSSVSSLTSSVTELPSQKYFELNNEAKNLINNYKYEQELKDISNEELEMKNNVRKIVTHAENVLDFTDLNKEYLEKIQLQHSESE